MSYWLSSFGAVVLVFLTLITFCTVLGVLHPDRERAKHARETLRLLLRSFMRW